MALTPSNMLPLGTKAPDFKLPDGNGNWFTLTDVTAAHGLLVVFMCNHCPYVIHIKSALAELGKQLTRQQIGMVGINANDVTNYPEDSPAKMVQDAAANGYTFPYLYDATQNVAKAYAAACTPDFYLFNANLALVYRGQFDASRPGNTIPVTGTSLYAAVDAMLSGQEPLAEQKPSIGCNIKWR